MSAQIATVKGRLTLTIADAPVVDLGQIEIPIEVAPSTEDDELVLTATPNMRQVRELIEQVFAQEPGSTPATPAIERGDIAHAWSNYSKDYGASGIGEHKAFIAGWDAAKGRLDAGGPLR